MRALFLVKIRRNIRHLVGCLAIFIALALFSELSADGEPAKRGACSVRMGTTRKLPFLQTARCGSDPRFASGGGNYNAAHWC